MDIHAKTKIHLTDHLLMSNFRPISKFFGLLERVARVGHKPLLNQSAKTNVRDLADRHGKLSTVDALLDTHVSYRRETL